jgi:excisionase family DNA binding protein
MPGPVEEQALFVRAVHRELLRGVDNNRKDLLTSSIAYAVERLAPGKPCPGATMATITPFDNYLDLVEAARELAIHPQSLRRLIKQKKIPATLFAGKYLIERDKLEMFKSNYDPRPGRKPIRRLL